MGTSAIEQGSARAHRAGRAGGRLRTIHYGIGPIGAEIARVAAAREGVEIVGAVDIDPAKVGRDLGEVVGLDRALGVPIVASAVGAMQDVIEHEVSGLLVPPEEPAALAAAIEATGTGVLAEPMSELEGMSDDELAALLAAADAVRAKQADVADL